jgi:hypothetical protein
MKISSYKEILKGITDVYPKLDTKILSSEVNEFFDSVATALPYKPKSKFPVLAICCNDMNFLMAYKENKLMLYMEDEVFSDLWVPYVSQELSKSPSFFTMLGAILFEFAIFHSSAGAATKINYSLQYLNKTELKKYCKEIIDGKVEELFVSDKV